MHLQYMDQILEIAKHMRKTGIGNDDLQVQILNASVLISMGINLRDLVRI